jgi:CubicO group peptidase (beta-lactamase class C family)
MTTLERSTTGLPVGVPGELGFSAERLARIGPAMQAFIDAGEIPGCVTLIARHGRIAHLEARGSTHLDREVPLREDAIFRIASATKPIATVALLMLYEEGLFVLDEPISRFLPAFKRMQVNFTPAEREISIRDCLTHTVGFATASRPGAMLAPQVEEPVSATVARLAEYPLSFQPGARWEYNSGITVAGHLVEIISGMDLGEFLRVRLFEPLGMPDTAFYLPNEKLERFLPAYEMVEKDSGSAVNLVETAENSVKVRGPQVRFDGSAGLLSTVSDYARFTQMLMNGGELDGVRILGRKTVQLMTTNQTGDLYIYFMGKGYGFGLGVSVRTDLGGVPLVGSVGSYGWPGAWGIWNQVDPVEQMTTLFFTQVNGYWQRRQARLSSQGAVPRWIEQFESLAHQALVD